MLSKRAKPASRVTIIGLDGASWTLLDPLIKSGDLPNLAKLVDTGASGVLMSTIPPVTASAWSSFYTGRTPGRHGVYDFRRRMGSESTHREWVTSGNIGGPKIWEIANAQGKNAGLINLPLTFPPVELDGYMIGGMPVPPTRDDIGWPSGLVDEIVRETGAYISDVDLLRGDSPDVSNPEKCFEFVNEVERAAKVRAEAVKFLMDKYPTDLTFLVLVAPDRLSHLFWQVLVPTPGMKRFAYWEQEL
ncbi:alkaline phosphatase family protein, partial [bacterium]|nr:alkaline phosphatase family protein [bacterium]